MKHEVLDEIEARARAALEEHTDFPLCAGANCPACASANTSLDLVAEVRALKLDIAAVADAAEAEVTRLRRKLSDENFEVAQRVAEESVSVTFNDYKIRVVNSRDAAEVDTLVQRVHTAEAEATRLRAIESAARDVVGRGRSHYGVESSEEWRALRALVGPMPVLAKCPGCRCLIVPGSVCQCCADVEDHFLDRFEVLK